MSDRLVVILADTDPVARAVGDVWGTLPAAEGHLDGATLRRLAPEAIVVRRPGPHIHDEAIDLRLPTAIREGAPTLVFPSIHRSEQNVPSLTVHPLGNAGPHADLGGRPRTLVPTDPRRMTSALRLLDEGASKLGVDATYEATHHGPAVGLPAFFVEIGYAGQAAPSAEAVRLLANVIPRIGSDPDDRVVVGLGGGHYAPHFTDLALHRHWAFGHLLSRHALAEVDRTTAAAAFATTAGAEGVLFARAQDALSPTLEGIGPRLRDQDAPLRKTRG